MHHLSQRRHWHALRDNQKPFGVTRALGEMSLLFHALQVEAHHYCSHLNEEVRQCIIYDSADNNARLIGIEYIISRRLFEALPEEEKKLWHSHQYEVRPPLHKALPVQVAVIPAEDPST